MTDFFMLVRSGNVQRLSTSQGLCWPIAETFDDAKRLCEWFDDSEVRVAQIGSVDNETLQGHIALAIDEGCSLIVCVLGWNDDGSPQWKHLSLDDPEA